MDHFKNKIKNIVVIFVVLIAIYPLNLFAQYDSEFEKLTIKDGLSNNDVWDVKQDQYGFLWIATKDGLNVYDGYNFRIFKNLQGDSTSLPSNDCNAVFEDKKNDIWIGTKVGLARYDRASETFENFQFSQNNTELSNSVWRIFEDSKQNLWIATNEGAMQFDRSKKEFVRFDIMRKDNTVAYFANNVSSIFETSNSDLYVGSVSYGLVKFDYSSKIFIQQKVKNSSTLFKANQIYEINEDLNGLLWLASFKGLFRINLDDLSIEDLSPFKQQGNPKIIRKNGVYGIYRDRFDNMWVGTSHHGILVYNSKKNMFNNIYASSSINYIGPFLEDRFGIIWVATTQGIWKYDLDKKPFDLIVPSQYFEEENNLAILSYENHETNSDQLWLGTSSGLYQFHKNTKSIKANSALLNKVNRPTKYIITTLLENSNYLWFGTRASGLFKYDLSSQRLLNFSNKLYDHNSIHSDRIFSLLDTRDKNIWIGTSIGINIIDKQTNKISSVPSLLNRRYNDSLTDALASLSKNSTPITSILSVGDYADVSKDFVLTKDENVIISAVGEGLFQWNMVDYGWLESEAGDTIWSCNDLYSTFHAGGNGKNRIKIGMFKLSKGRYRLRYISDDSHSTASYNAPPPKDTLSWGISLHALSDDKFNEYEKIWLEDNSKEYLDGNTIQKLILASDSSIWAATNFGISKIDPKSLSVTNYRKNEDSINSLNSELVNDIIEDLNGNIWIASEDGLNLLQTQTNEFSVVKEKNGLPTNNIRSLQVDDSGDLWIGSSNGISKVEISAGYKNPVIINYDVKDGLQGYDFLDKASYKDNEGRLYFSGLEGFNQFLPGKSNNTLANIVIKNILVSNKSIKEYDAGLLSESSLSEISEFELPHNQNDLSFEFSSIHYSRPDKNRIQYKMEGVDEGWILTDRRYATYTNLDPGDYIFKVKGSNGDGIWNEDVRQINISISPPWYNNWTAYSIYAALFLGLLYSVRRFEMVRQKKNAQIKESRLELEATKLKAEAAEAKALVVQAENDRKTQELEEARQLQLSMLPKVLPQIPNLDIAVYMKTATEVGGDYYDFHIGMDGTLTVVLGDATGHGMKAGTMVTTTKSLFNVLAPNPNIVETFHEMTRCLKLMQLEKLSMCMTMLKIVGNSVQMSAAGMPPVFIYKRENQSIEEHVMKGMPLGTFSNFPYSVIESNLESGDIILLMSDGFPELFNDKKEMYGYKRTRNLFEELSEESPENIIGKLKDAGSDWVNDKDPDDDVTFVVIKVK